MEKSIKRYFPVFLLPTFLAFIIGFIVPFLMGIYLSFCDFRTVTDAVPNGLTNYIRAFQDAEFVHAFFFTAGFTIVTVVLINVQHLPHRLLYAQPHWRHCAGVHLAADF